MEKKIVNTCNTCRLPIHEGEPTYYSGRGETSGHTQGTYGGASYHNNQNISYHGEWQGEILAKNEWNKKFGMWLAMIVLPATALTCLIVWYINRENPNNSNRVTNFGFASFFLSAGMAWVINGIKNGFFAPSVNRYKLRKRIAV